MPNQGLRVCFPYQHEYRVVDVTSVWMSSEGNWLLTGKDVDKGEYRSFRMDRIAKKIRVVKS